VPAQYLYPGAGNYLPQDFCVKKSSSMQNFSVEEMKMNKTSKVLGSLVLPGVVMVLAIGLLFAFSNLSLAQQGIGWPTLPDSSAPPALKPSPTPSPAPIEVEPSPAPVDDVKKAKKDKDDDGKKLAKKDKDDDNDDGDDDGKGKGKKKGKGHEKGKGKGHEHHDD